jgi:hypothetical protein
MGFKKFISFYCERCNPEQNVKPRGYVNMEFNDFSAITTVLQAKFLWRIHVLDWSYVCNECVSEIKKRPSTSIDL